MATLQVIYQIAADISKLESGVQRGAASLQKIETGFDRVTSAAGKIGAVLGGAFSVGALVNFGQALIDDADALMRMSDQTGVGVEALQRLQAIAGDSGNTLEQLTSAISQMQNRLAEGDQSAVGALERLGVSLADLREQKPDQQFMTIARSIATIEDPMERTRTAMDLFGKAGAQILPSLRAEVDAIAASTVVMSDEGVRKWDALGDAIGKFWRNFKATVGNALVATREETEALEHMADVIDGFATLDTKKLGLPSVGSGLPRGQALTVPGLPSNEVMLQADLQLMRLKTSNEKLLESTRESRQEHERSDKLWKTLNASLASHTTALRSTDLGTRQFTQSLLHEDPAIHNLDVRLAKLTTTVKAWGQELQGVVRYLYDWEAAHRRALELVTVFNSQLMTMPSRIKTAAESFREAGSVTQRVGDYLSQVESILGGVQASWAQMVTVAVRGIKAIAQNLAEGDWIGAIVSGLTAFGNAIANAFRDEQWERVNDMRDAFQNTFGTFDDMARAAAKAGYQIERLLDTKRVADFEREMRLLNEAIQFQEDSMKFLDDTVKKYGFTLEELGPAFQRQRLDEQAQQLFKEFSALTAAGISMDTVLLRMGDSINEFVQNALATGTEIPAAMAPMIQRMVEMGKLTDANGNIITNLEDAGVRFSMTMSEGFQALIAEVKNLTDAIARGLGGAIRNLPPLNVPVNRVNVGGMDLDLPVQPMADGGRGMATRPTLFLAGEAGPEEFAFSGAGRRFSGGSPQVIVVESYLDGQLISKSSQQHMSQELRSRHRLRAA